MAAFQRRFYAMKALKDSWIKGKEAVVIEADEDSSYQVREVNIFVHSVI